MKIRVLVAFLLLFCAYQAKSLTPIKFVIDFDGFLVTQKQSTAIWEIGPSHFLGFGYNPWRVQDHYFEFLRTIPLSHPGMPVVMHHGRQLPCIMCDWLAGLQSPEEIRKRIHVQLNLILSHDKGSMARFGAITDFIFTPEKFIKAIIPVKKGAKLLKKLYDQRDQYGQRVHKLFLLTNWDLSSFQLLYGIRSIRKILDLFDDVLVSGAIHLLKPDPAIYTYAFEYFDIDPEQELVVYIDDEEGHITAARRLGKKKLRCIWCEDFNIDRVEKDIKRLGGFR